MADVMNRYNELKEHINRFVRISDSDFEQMLTYVNPISAKKKQNLHEAGKVCKSNFFVREGCLRLFFINDKGVEQTIQFALENWWLSDYSSFSSQQTSLFYIQAVEKSEVVAIDFSAQEEHVAAISPNGKVFQAHSSTGARCLTIQAERFVFSNERRNIP